MSVSNTAYTRDSRNVFVPNPEFDESQSHEVATDVAKKRSTTRQPRSTVGTARTDTLDATATAAAEARSLLEQAGEVCRSAACDTTVPNQGTTSPNVEDLLDGALKFVRRHPTTGLLIAGAVGFLVGRIGRR